jgi:flagellar hook-length control protein FliK
MTTDRTAALPRSTALAERPASASGRNAASPSDAFAALLGAADQSRSEQAPRRDDSRPRRDDSRPEQPRRADHARRPDGPRTDQDRLRREDVARLRSDKPATQAAAETAAAAAPTPAPADPVAPVDAAPVTPPLAAVTPPVVAPEIFALQLTSPLRPAAATQAGDAADATAALTGLARPPLAVTAATTAQAGVPATGDAATPAAGPLPGDATATATATTTATATATGNATGTLPTDPASTPATPSLALPDGLTTDPAAADAVDLPVDAAQPATPGATPSTTDAAPLAQDDAGTASTGDQQTPSDSQPQEQPGTPVPAAAAAPQVKPADAPVTPAVTAAQPVGATSATATAPVAPAPQTTTVERTVPLGRLVSTTGTMLHVAHERGITHARLNLKPVELGGIEVRLQTSPQGVTAQLIADSPEAARMLQGASDDLRRQLEANNVTLLALDVSTSSDQRQPASSGGPDGFAQHHNPGGASGSRNGGPEPTAAPLVETTIALPDGVLVDVLA